MRNLLLSLGAVALATTVFTNTTSAQSGCVFSGISTQDIEYSADDYTAWHATWVPENCAIRFSLYKNSPYFIGNYYLTGHYVMYGDALLDPSIPLDWPFYGHNVLILPTDILGPYSGGESEVAPPNDPNLVGVTFYIQLIATFITTVHFPIETEFSLQHAMALTFQ